MGTGRSLINRLLDSFFVLGHFAVYVTPAKALFAIAAELNVQSVLHAEEVIGFRASSRCVADGAKPVFLAFSKAKDALFAIGSMYGHLTGKRFVAITNS